MYKLNRQYYFIIYLMFPIYLLVSCSNGINGHQNKNELTLTVTETWTFGPVRGWGNGMIIQTPDKKVFLYDAGLKVTNYDGDDVKERNYPDTYFDGGKDIIGPFLRAQRIDTIDGILISHSHADHFGGFEYLMDHFKVLHLYDSGIPIERSFTSNRYYDKVLKPKYIALGGEYTTLISGNTLSWGEYVKLEILSPPKGYIPIDSSHYVPEDPLGHHDPNLNSVVVRMTYKNIVFLFLGDLNKIGQKWLMDNIDPKKLKADVLCLAHQDKETYPYMEFAEAISPKVVVVGLMNGVYGPAINAEKQYGKVGAKVYATCWNGQIQLKTDGNDYKVEVKRDKSSPISNMKIP